MMKKSGAVVVIIALIFVGVIVALQLGNKEAAAPSQNPTDTTQDQATQDGSTMGTDEPLTTITYTEEGFAEQDNVRVKSGVQVRISNKSSRTLDFASDDHPSHQLNSELNVGEISPGEEETVILNTKGEWGFHNHLQSTHEGTITVE
ncbi:MAG: cupredoxin domain-containing protein [bacterium]|nr:cupredoxin domain-containing protein [bacterium]